MKKIRINTSKPYDVIIQRGGLKNAGEYISSVIKSKRTVIITDDTVGGIYGEILGKSLEKSGISYDIFTFPHGEASKNLSTLGDIFNFLCSCELTRSDFIIALGGGVTGDMAGFAAGAYLRGISFVQIPTTLLAQIDSSVGGKTAVDLPGGKNLVGLFKQPDLVICDSDTLDTLTDEIFADGMAEAIKYGLIRDKSLFELIENHNSGNIRDVIDDVVYSCIDIKRDVVENDEFERGERMILNFGHTIGHALEAHHNYTDYTHGQGVAAGMCYISRRFAPADISERLEKCVKCYGLPTDDEAGIENLLSYCSRDKKCESDNINYIVCEEIGKAQIRKSSLSEFRCLMEEKNNGR